MSTTAAAVAAPTRAGFLRSRLGSILAFFPLGIWTANHLFDNLAALRGAAEWQAAVTHHDNQVAHFLTMVFVLLPLALHTAWGLKRVFTTKPNIGHYQTYANLKYIVQRLSAIGLLGFLGAHLWLAMFHPRFVEGHEEAFSDIAAHMRHHPPTLAVYVLGTLGVAYHLANGLQSLAMGWGVVTSRKALKQLEIVVYGVFFALAAMGFTAIYALFQAGNAFPVPLD